MFSLMFRDVHSSFPSCVHKEVIISFLSSVQLHQNYWLSPRQIHLETANNGTASRLQFALNYDVL